MTKMILEEPFSRRVVLALLLPNVLVIGFIAEGLNTKRNPLWPLLIEPYWRIERYLLFILLAVILWFAALDLVAFWTSISSQDDDCVFAEEPTRKQSSFDCDRPQEQQNTPVPKKPEVPAPVYIQLEKPKLTALELQEKALRDFIGRD